MKRPPNRFAIAVFAGLVLLPLETARAQVGRFVIQARDANAISNTDLRTLAVGIGAPVDGPYASVDRPEIGANLIATELSRDDAIALRDGRPDLLVEEDLEVTTNGGPPGVQPPPWSPDRIDQRLGMDTQYFPKMLAPCGGYRPWVYVCDTGVFAGHDEFTLAGERIQFAGSYIPALLNRTIPALQDPYDHGTAVAACAVGEYTGSGRCPANIVSAVCYPDPGAAGGGTFVSFAADVIYWSLNEHLLRSIDGDPFNDASVLIFASSTLNGPSQILDLAVERARLAGMVVVVSAGNQNMDAVNTSPAGAFSPVHGDITTTVAASTALDARWANSNYGALVELFAPGDNVLCASSGAANLCTLRAGTSFAAGYVAGSAMRILARNPWASAAQVSNQLINIGDPVHGPSGPFGAGVNGVPKLSYVNPALEVRVPLHYDAWETLYALQLPGPDVDSDGDGFINVLEYLMALDPNVFDPASHRPSIAMESGGLQYRFRKANFLAETTMFEVQISHNCLDWTPLPDSFIMVDESLPCSPEASAMLATIPDRNGANNYFVRVAIISL